MTQAVLLSLAFVYASSLNAVAQPDGLWLVTRVDVGSEVMTPVSKWFRLSNGQLASGNGWQQHTFGTYTWNRVTSELSLVSENEPSDGYGAFLVAQDGNSMIWTRKEDGDIVKVRLIAIVELPKSPADNVKGFWDLVEATRSGVDAIKDIDPDGRYYIFLRWDRVFVRRINAKEKAQGYWFMNGHRPELKLMRDQQETETWTAGFDGDNLILTGVSESVTGIVLTFARSSAFQN
jgi:hypothetical protein